MSARRRTARDLRRRRLGQNFLKPAVADHFVDQAHFQQDDLVVEIGAGLGTITHALAQRRVTLLALEVDAVWQRELRKKFKKNSGVKIIARDFFDFALPAKPFRVTGSLPFGRTTDILRRLLDDPASALTRADIIVQWDVAKKRGQSPPTTLLSTSWAPWWDVQFSGRIPARDFRPVPKVDAGILTITRRDPPLLPPAMAATYADFVRKQWPFRE